MRVLVVDDHREFRDEVLDILGRNGHKARGVASADDAIPLAQSGEYDFVFVDFSMPGHDGVWFMENVRLPRGTKALLVTAHVYREVINRMFRLGVAGYIIKPFDEAGLLAQLDTYAGIHHVKTRATEEKIAPAGVTPVTKAQPQEGPPIEGRRGKDPRSVRRTREGGRRSSPGEQREG